MTEESEDLIVMLVLEIGLENRLKGAAIRSIANFPGIAIKEAIFCTTPNNALDVNAIDLQNLLRLLYLVTPHIKQHWKTFLRQYLYYPY